MRQTVARNPAESRLDRVVDFHLLGEVDFDDVLCLQRRLVYELSAAQQPRAAVLLCEHPPIITVGRVGSRGHVKLSNDELNSHQLPTRWVDRSGGCILHAPGQLAVYLIVPLAQFGWTLDEFAGRLQSVATRALDLIGVRTQIDPGGCGLWGRTGLLAAIGTAIEKSTAVHDSTGLQDCTTYQGLFINVAPAMSTFGFVETAQPFAGAAEKTTMSCLLAERRQPVRMSTVRSALIEQLARSFECDRHNVHTGHVWLRDRAGSERERTAYAC